MVIIFFIFIIFAGLILSDNDKKLYAFIEIEKLMKKEWELTFLT